MKHKPELFTRKQHLSQVLTNADLSPLDHIRQTEADMIRAVAAARESAEQIIANAHSEAADLKRQAREAGLQEGQAHYKATIAEAEEEAKVILAEAHDQAKKLRLRAHRQIEHGVSQVLDVILGLVWEAEET
jgi:vacuolar-type H+-ATPase subunit H